MTQDSRLSRSRMAAVRATYDVPAHRGGEVVFHGSRLRGPLRCTILSSTGSHLYLRDAEGDRIGPCHPTWGIDYLDGRGDRTGQPTPMDRAWGDV